MAGWRYAEGSRYSQGQVLKGAPEVEEESLVFVGEGQSGVQLDRQTGHTRNTFI